MLDALTTSTRTCVTQPKNIAGKLNIHKQTGFIKSIGVNDVKFSRFKSPWVKVYRHDSSLNVQGKLCILQNFNKVPDHKFRIIFKQAHYGCVTSTQDHLIGATSSIDVDRKEVFFKWRPAAVSLMPRCGTLIKLLTRDILLYQMCWCRCFAQWIGLVVQT